MTTRTGEHGAHPGRQEHLNQVRQAQVKQERRRQWRVRAAWAVAVVAVIALIAAMALSSRQESSSKNRVAPLFTLTDTSGTMTSLAALRGKNVLLFFSEGAGCQPCFTEMAQIEKDPGFAAAALTVLPIVMNTREQVVPEMAANGVRTPFLLDNGTVSKAYGTIGKGMHAELPGHGFVLIDKTGKQRWYGEYPSMFISTTDLLKQVQSHLTD